MTPRELRQLRRQRDQMKKETSMGEFILCIFVIFSIAFMSGTAHSWAIPFDPPAKYNHPYKGELVVERMPFSHLQHACKRLLNQLPNYKHCRSKSLVGCAVWWKKPKRKCHIIVIDKPYKGMDDYRAFLHERAHCNEWKHPFQICTGE